MSQQTPAGWYPDGQGTTRYWDGTAWTEQTQGGGGPDAAVPTVAKKEGAFARLKKASTDRSAAKREAKEAEERKWAEDVAAAGALVTSGTFGLSTLEIYEGGYVRVASGEQPERAGVANVRTQMAANLSGGGISPKTPYEKLRSITFTPSEADQAQGGSGLESALGPAVAGLLKGTKHLMKTSAPGLAAAGITHVVSQGARTSYLTVATDRQIYTLSNQVPNSVGLKTAKKGHVDVGRALEAAGNAVLGIDGSTADAGAPALQPAVQPEAVITTQTSTPGLADRLRELATLHQEGILSDEEFANAKTKLLGGL